MGIAFAHEAAARGFDLILSARDMARLRALADELRDSGRDVICIDADLGQTGAAEALWQEASAGREITMLINNAGLGAHGRFQNPDLADAQRSIVAVNVVAATELMRHAASAMAAAGKGRILNVASSAAFMPGPMMASYHASKSFLLSLSEGASVDLKNTGVTVTALCPGPVKTGFFEAGNAKGALATKASPMADPNAIVKAGMDAAMAGKRLIVPGLLYKLITFSTRFAPRGMLLRMAARFWHK